MICNPIIIVINTRCGYKYAICSPHDELVRCIRHLRDQTNPYIDAPPLPVPVGSPV